MGKIVTELTITNHGDEIRAVNGDIPADAVRFVTRDDVVIDMGASTLCLPRALIAQLGLALLRETTLSTAAGPSHARVFQDAKVTLLGRQGTFECVELQDGTPPLLGVIPLEALGIEPDVRNQALRVLPEESYMTAYGATLA